MIPESLQHTTLQTLMLSPAKVAIVLQNQAREAVVGVPTGTTTRSLYLDSESRDQINSDLDG